jgi:hypothetical protein
VAIVIKAGNRKTTHRIMYTHVNLASYEMFEAAEENKHRNDHSIIIMNQKLYNRTEERKIIKGRK